MSTLKFNKWQSIDGVTRNAVLQVVSKKVTTETSTTSTTFVDATDMFLAITPTSATSNILLLFQVGNRGSRSSNSVYVGHRLMRDGTEIYNPSGEAGGAFYTQGIAVGGATAATLYAQIPIIFLDSPSTTNEITYKLQFSIYQNTTSGTAYINPDGLSSTITLMEIAQ